jgi:hypothetical protein
MGASRWFGPRNSNVDHNDEPGNGMYSDDWIVKAKLIGEFCLVQSQSLQAEHIPGLRRFLLSSEVGEDGRPTGVHALEVELRILPKDGTDKTTSVVDFARETVSRLAARIAVSSGRTVDIAEGTSIMQFDSKDSRRGRAVFTATGAHLAAPTPIATEFLAAAAKPSLERAMHWWAQSLRIADPADSLHSLFVALDLVAAPLKPPVSRERKCKNCGFVDALQPGLREKVVYLLTERCGLSQSLAEEIYEMRNALTHGSVSVSEEKKRVLRQHAAHLQVAIRDEIAAQMSCALPPLPSFLPFDFPSSHLIVDFTTEDKNEPTN